MISGCAPGGGASNFWTILLDGNVNLSVTMTFFSTLASLGSYPEKMVCYSTDLMKVGIWEEMESVTDIRFQVVLRFQYISLR